MLFVVDMSSLIHAYFHVRNNDDMYDVTERVLTRLERLRNYFLERFSECSFVAVFDNDKETFRHLLYPKYKAGRTHNEELPEIINNVLEAVEHDYSWIPVVASLLLEADDVIAALARQYNGRVIIHSSDKDLRSCLENGRVTIIRRSYVDEQKKMLAFEWYSFNSLFEEYGFGPDRWIDFRAIVGDGSDNLLNLSWRWAGEEMAKKVITSGLELDKLFMLDENLNLNKRQIGSYPEFRRNLPLHYNLLRMRDDMPWPYELEHLKQLEMVSETKT